MGANQSVIKWANADTDCRIQEIFTPARGVTSIQFKNRKLQEFAIPARGITSSKIQYLEVKKRCVDTAAVLYYLAILKKRERTSNVAPLSTQ